MSVSSARNSRILWVGAAIEADRLSGTSGIECFLHRLPGRGARTRIRVAARGSWGHPVGARLGVGWLVRSCEKANQHSRTCSNFAEKILACERSHEFSPFLNL